MLTAPSTRWRCAASFRGASLSRPVAWFGISQEVSAAVAQKGAKGVADMGKVMGVLKSKLAGRADLGKVSAMVKAKLAG